MTTLTDYQRMRVEQMRRRMRPPPPPKEQPQDFDKALEEFRQITSPPEVAPDGRSK